MTNTVVKHPDFPMEHVTLIELKDTTKIAEMVEDADVMITQNNEVVGYLISPAHYELMVNTVLELGAKVTAGFLKSREEKQDGLQRLDQAYQSSLRDEWASREEEAEVFGD